MNKKLNAKEVEKMIREFIEDPDFYVWVAPADLYEEYRDIFDKYIRENKIRVSKAEINGKKCITVSKVAKLGKKYLIKVINKLDIDIEVSDEDLEKDLKLEIAVILYKRKLISFKRAIKLFKLSEEEFIKELAKHGIKKRNIKEEPQKEYVSVTEYSPEEYLELAYFGD